jgi:hypothetical protein
MRLATASAKESTAACTLTPVLLSDATVRADQIGVIGIL